MWITTLSYIEYFCGKAFPKQAKVVESSELDRSK